MTESSRAPDPSGRHPSRWSRARTRALVAIPLAACHVALFAFIFVPASQPEPPMEPVSVAVTMIQPPKPPPPPPPPLNQTDPGGQPAGPPSEAPTPPKPTPPKPVVVKPTPRLAKTPPPPEVPPLPSRPAVAEPNVVLGEAALAGATVAGSGSGGGGEGGAGGGSGGGECDMVRRLQDALRRDPEVRMAVTQTHRAIGAGGRAILVWNGEWLRSPGQDGKGLAGVRQAIAMEVAFAPAACKARPMQGLAVISFADAAGAPKLALGGGQWRWSDLLSARR